MSVDAESMTPIVNALSVQIATYGSYVTIAVAAIKKVIKIILKMKPEEKLNRFVPLSLIGVFGIAAGFILKSPLVTGTVLSIVFGFLIALFAVISYDSVVNALLKLIPGLVKRFFGGK